MIMRIMIMRRSLMIILFLQMVRMKWILNSSHNHAIVFEIIIAVFCGCFGDFHRFNLALMPGDFTKRLKGITIWIPQINYFYSPKIFWRRKVLLDFLVHKNNKVGLWTSFNVVIHPAFHFQELLMTLGCQSVWFYGDCNQGSLGLGREWHSERHGKCWAHLRMCDKSMECENSYMGA